MNKTLRKSDIRNLNKEIENSFSVKDFFSKKDQIELTEEKIILKNKQPFFFYHNKELVPSLKLILEQKCSLKKVTVDMGAVKFVVSGADIMRPGITLFENNIQKDELIVIQDENNKKPLSIGIMLFSGEEANSMQAGKVIKNIHYVGDDLWKFVKN